MNFWIPLLCAAVFSMQSSDFGGFADSDIQQAILRSLGKNDEERTDQISNFGNKNMWNQNDDFEQAIRNSLKENNHKPADQHFENNVLNENEATERAKNLETIAQYYKDLEENPLKEVETREAKNLEKDRKSNLINYDASSSDEWSEEEKMSESMDESEELEQASEAIRNSKEESSHKHSNFENKNLLNDETATNMETIAQYYNDLSEHPLKEVDDETREANKLKKYLIIEQLIKEAQPLQKYGYSDRMIQETIKELWGYAFKCFDENMPLHHESAKEKILHWMSIILKDLQKNALDNMQIARNTDNCELFRALRRKDYDLVSLEQNLEGEQHRYQLKKCQDAQQTLFKRKPIKIETVYDYEHHNKYEELSRESYKRLMNLMMIDQQNVCEHLYPWLAAPSTGMNLNQSNGVLKRHIDHEISSFSTFLELTKVGMTCRKYYNQMCTGQHFTTSITLNSEYCSCGVFSRYGGCTHMRGKPSEFELIPCFENFDKIHISLTQIESSEENSFQPGVDVDFCLEDKNGVLKRYQAGRKQLEFEIWKSEKGFKVVTGEDSKYWTITDCPDEERNFQIKNQNKNENKNIKMKLHFFKEK